MPNNYNTNFALLDFIDYHSSLIRDSVKRVHIREFRGKSLPVLTFLLLQPSLGISYLTCIHNFQAQSCNQDFSSNNSTMSSFCSCKRFIMESYHGEYGSLLDSDFQDFIARGLPSGLCGMLPDDLPRLSVLQRNLIGEGSHRLLSSSIRLNIEPKSLTKLPTHSCEVILIERLPIGVFADPFELQHLLQRGGKILHSFLLIKREIVQLMKSKHTVLFFPKLTISSHLLQYLTI